MGGMAVRGGVQASLKSHTRTFGTTIHRFAIYVLLRADFVPHRILRSFAEACVDVEARLQSWWPRVCGRSWLFLRPMRLVQLQVVNRICEE